MKDANEFNVFAFTLAKELKDLRKNVYEKRMELSKFPIAALKHANDKNTDVFEKCLDAREFRSYGYDMVDTGYQLFNATKRLADEIYNATMFIGTKFELYGEKVIEKVTYERTWYQNAFVDIFSDAVENIEDRYRTDKKECVVYTFSAIKNIGTKFFADMKNCVAEEYYIDDGIHKFMSNLKNYEETIDTEFYEKSKECMTRTIYDGKIFCLNKLFKIKPRKLLDTRKAMKGSKTAQIKSQTRVTKCLENLRPKMLAKMGSVYHQNLLCFESYPVKIGKHQLCSIKGIDKLKLWFLDGATAHTVCPLKKPLVEAFDHGFCPAARK